MFLFSTNISSVAHCCMQFLHIEHNSSISSTLSTILVHQITTHVPYSIWILVFCKHHSVSAQKRIFWTFKPITKPYFLLYATHWLHFVTIYSCTGHHIRTKCSIFVSMPWCLLKHKMNTLQNSLPDKTRDRNNFFITLSIQVCHLSWLVWIILFPILCSCTHVLWPCAAKHSCFPHTFVMVLVIFCAFSITTISHNYFYHTLDSVQQT